MRSEEAPESEGLEASVHPKLPRGDDGTVNSFAINSNTDEKYLYFKEFHSDLPENSAIDPDDLKRIGDSLLPSHIIDERSELMDEFARFIDDGPAGPITPDAAMMERLRSITHPGKRGGCYTFENGVVVEKRGGCGTLDTNTDVDADVNVDLNKRGG